MKLKISKLVALKVQEYILEQSKYREGIKEMHKDYDYYVFEDIYDNLNLKQRCKIPYYKQTTDYKVKTIFRYLDNHIKNKETPYIEKLLVRSFEKPVRVYILRNEKR